jgi:hypothetical protein
MDMRRTENARNARKLKKKKKRRRSKKCKRGEREKEKEEVYGQKQKEQKEPIPLRNSQARMQCNETEWDQISEPPKKTKQIHYFSLFLPQIDLALDRPAGLPPGPGDSGGGGGAAGCCCFDVSLRLSAGDSSMYLGL